MNASTNVLRAILDQEKIESNDILYALDITKHSLDEIATECGVSRKFIYDVISEKRRSFDVATCIANKLSTTTSRLWGDAYNYTPRKPSVLGHVANG
ncbi:MAG: hypothetical protein JKX92_12250 [Porticoccaceae bacterium]|nr:hypothetical protein [Porticoccaceae bacterium]